MTIISTIFYFGQSILFFYSAKHLYKEEEINFKNILGGGTVHYFRILVCYFFIPLNIYYCQFLKHTTNFIPKLILSQTRLIENLCYVVNGASCNKYG